MSDHDQFRIHLSLVSHTNIGKTTLARTLLMRDVGEVADRAHVTETTDDYVLARDSAGCELVLWDTPGFGNSDHREIGRALWASPERMLRNRQTSPLGERPWLRTPS